MKAVIMAGGEGTRLRPLTCDMPKPMARLCGRPVIEHIIDLLSRNGVDEAAVTLRYLPEDIKNDFPDLNYCGVKLRFYEEDRPLGTAGGIVAAASGFGSDFIVISGDAMCDFNLKAAMDFHRENGAAATIVLSRVADPREYGLVVTDPQGAVRGFVEKPGWAQAVTDAVNTGIYIISPSALPLIPRDLPCDFAKDLFPQMLEKGMRVYGFEADGYWCDIGDIGAYTSCQFDMLDGRVDCRVGAQEKDGVLYKGRIPQGNFTVKPPAYIGAAVHIGDYAQIGPFAVIDDGCTVGMGASVKNSVILQDAYIGERCELRGALVCRGASLKKRAGMYEGSVAGAGSLIGSDASVSPGVRIWPGKTVEDGARAAANIKTGCARHGIFDDDGIAGEVGADLTPEVGARIGAAAGSAAEGTRVGVGSDGSVAGGVIKNAAAAGAVSSGAEVCDFGGCFESMFNFAVTFFGLDMGIFIRTTGSRAVMELRSAGGLSIGRQAERKMETGVSTGDIRRCAVTEYREPYFMPGIAPLYRRELKKRVPDGFPAAVSVKSPNKEIQRLFSQVLRDCGIREPSGENEGSVRVHIDASGASASFFCEDGSYLNPLQTLLVGCIASFEKGEDVALPFGAPRAVDAVAEKYGRRVLRYLECPADKSDRDARKLAMSETFVRDGLENALRVMSYAASRGRTLSSLAGLLPRFAVSQKSISCAVNPGELLRGLSQGAISQPSEGVVITNAGTSVLVSPLKRGTGIMITAEAGDMETAGELCADIERKLLSGGQAIDNSTK